MRVFLLIVVGFCSSTPARTFKYVRDKRDEDEHRCRGGYMKH